MHIFGVELTGVPIFSSGAQAWMAKQCQHWAAILLCLAFVIKNVMITFRLNSVVQLDLCTVH